jgi:hypothetical protein
MKLSNGAICVDPAGFLSMQALATAVDTFLAVLETHRWVPSSALVARSRRTTDDRSADGAPAGAAPAASRVSPRSSAYA